MKIIVIIISIFPSLRAKLFYPVWNGTPFICFLRPFCHGSAYKPFDAIIHFKFKQLLFLFLCPGPLSHHWWALMTVLVVSPRGKCPRTYVYVHISVQISSRYKNINSFFITHHFKENVCVISIRNNSYNTDVTNKALQ